MRRSIKAEYGEWRESTHGSGFEMEVEEDKPFIRARAVTDAEENQGSRPRLLEPMSRQQLPGLLSRAKACNLRQMLARHDITARHRAAMLDWMVEVLAVFEQPESALFRAVWILDSFLARSKQRETLESLHLAGATAMFLASKFEAVRQIPSAHFETKICKGRFSRETLLAKELEIFGALDFSLACPTPYELVRMLVSLLELPEDSQAAFVEQSALLIAKMCLFSADLMNEVSLLEISAIAVMLAIRMLQSADKSFDSEGFEEEVLHLLSLNAQSSLFEQKVVVVHRLVKDFESIFPFAINLKKFGGQKKPQN